MGGGAEAKLPHAVGIFSLKAGKSQDGQKVEGKLEMGGMSTGTFPGSESDGGGTSQMEPGSVSIQS